MEELSVQPVMIADQDADTLAKIVDVWNDCDKTIDIYLSNNRIAAEHLEAQQREERNASSGSAASTTNRPRSPTVVPKKACPPPPPPPPKAPTPSPSTATAAGSEGDLPSQAEQDTATGTEGESAEQPRKKLHERSAIYRAAAEAENNRVKSILIGVDKASRAAAFAGNPLTDHHATATEMADANVSGMDFESWTLAGTDFWMTYLARMTQYTLTLRCGGSHEIAREARAWSVLRMLS